MHKTLCSNLDLVPKNSWDLLPKAGSAINASALPDELPDSVTLLAASQESQPANEITNLGGIYTYWIGRAIEEPDDQLQADLHGDGDGFVELGEAHEYAHERVLSYTTGLGDPGSIQEPFSLHLQAVADVVVATR